MLAGPASASSLLPPAALITSTACASFCLTQEMSNSLRGGKKSFSGKTLIGNFVEDGGANGRNIASGQFTTVAMSMNYTLSGKPGMFGAGLGLESDKRSPIEVNLLNVLSKHYIM